MVVLYQGMHLKIADRDGSVTADRYGHPSTSNCSLSGVYERFWSEKSTIGKVFFGVAKYLAGLLNSWQTLWVCVCVCLGQNEVVCRFNFAGESGRHEELFQYPLSLDVDAQLGNVSK